MESGVREIIHLLFQSKIPFLVIGGFAVNAYRFNRATQDVDCMVASENRTVLAKSLTDRGFVEFQMDAGFSRFRHESIAYPVVDVMRVDESTWSKMWPARMETELFGIPVQVPALPHLIALKLHAMKQNPERLLKDGNDITQLLLLNPGLVTADDLKALCERYAPADYFETLRPYIR